MYKAKIIDKCEDLNNARLCSRKELLDYLARLYVHFIGHCALMALRCLALLFAPMKQKKLETNIPYILKIVPVSVYAFYHSA